MYKTKLSIITVSDKKLDIGFDNNINDWEIFTISENELLKQKSSSKSRYVILFRNMLEFEKGVDENILYNEIKLVFKYIEEKNINGDILLMLNYIIGRDQFGFALSLDLIKLLASHNCSFNLTGISFDDD